MKDKYIELTVSPSSHSDLFLDFLQTVFKDAMEIKDDSFIIRSTEPVDDIVWGLKQFSSSLSKTLNENIDVKCETDIKENIDWIAKYRAGITPVEVGDFYVYPSWELPKSGKQNIMIDPALAFGSGHHETTSSCLQAIDKYVKRGDELLDVGCGSGILGIAASMMGAKVDACDTDPMAVENAQKNFLLNDQKTVNMWEGSAPGSEKEYDIVVANIVADVLKMIAKDLKKRTKQGGILIMSGILDKNEASIEEAFKDMQLLESIAKNEWRTKIYKKQGK